MNFLIIDQHYKTGQVIFKNFTFKISRGFQAVGIFGRRSILQHHLSSFIIRIGQCKSRG